MFVALTSTGGPEGSGIAEKLRCVVEFKLHL